MLALAKIGPAARLPIPALVTALRDEDRTVRLEAVRALGAIRPEQPAVAEALLKRLHDPDEEFCNRCRESLVAIGPGSVGPLSAALKADKVATRRAAAELLKKMGPDARSAVPALCTAAKDSDAPVRAGALAALRAVVPEPADGKADAAVLQAFDTGLRDADGEVRIGAHLGMIRLGRAATATLSTTLQNPDPAVRRLAAETLQKLGPDARAAAPALVAALRDSDAEVRDGAGWALEAIDAELGAAVPALRQAPAAPRKVGAVAQSTKEPAFLLVGELTALAAGEPGNNATQALRELSLRRGEPALVALALAAVSEDRTVRPLGREMLVKCLATRPDEKAEEDAARRLKLARRLLDEGARDAAKDNLRAFIKTYSRTRAAEEARGLLTGIP